MKLEFRILAKKDYKKAIAFAVVGMHCNVYFGSRTMANLYGRFLLYYGIAQATQMIAAYDGDRFRGLLLSRIDGEEPCPHPRRLDLFLNLVNLIQRTFSRGGAGEYGAACEELLREYKSHEDPDGEIVYLAVDPAVEGEGIGTAILQEYEHREKGKLVYLYTDDQCTYQFYDHRGFTLAGEKDIVMDLKEKVPLRCMLYSKRIG